MNYNIVMEDIIARLDTKPRLLLHACCGICSSSVIERLHPHFKITILFYNPNIYPTEEYEKRLNTLKTLLKELNYDIDLLEYGRLEEDFVVTGLENEKEGGKRCNKCFYIRLEKTAKIAKENNYDFFTTTLSVSPYKNAAKLNEIGNILENKYKIPYLYSDFKKKDGYKRSNELSYKFNLYRQNYCGCEYSLNGDN